MNNHKVLALPDFGGGRVRKNIKDYPEVYDTSITKSHIQILERQYYSDEKYCKIIDFALEK